jgi:autotransporter-associated beta strand protein
VDKGAHAYFDNEVTTTLLTVQGGATVQLEPNGSWNIDEVNTGTVGGAGRGTVVFNKEDDTLASPNNTLNGKITGAGDVEKIGAGSMWLQGDNTYTGDTTVHGGLLLIGSAMPSGGGLGTRYDNSGVPTEITSRNYAGKITIDTGATLGFYAPDLVSIGVPTSGRVQELSGLIRGAPDSILLVTEDRRVEISGSADNTPTQYPSPDSYNHFRGNLEIVDGGYLNVSGRLDVREESFDQNIPWSAATYTQHIYTGNMIVEGGGTLEFSYNRDWTLTTGNLSGSPDPMVGKGNFVVNSGQHFYFTGSGAAYPGHTEVKGAGTVFHLPAGGPTGAVWGMPHNAGVSQAGNFEVRAGAALVGGGARAGGGNFATTLNVGKLVMSPGSVLNVLPGGFKVNVADVAATVLADSIRITIEATTATAKGTYVLHDLSNTTAAGVPGAANGAALTFANTSGVVFAGTGATTGLVLPAHVNLQVGGSILVNGGAFYEYVLMDGLNVQSIVSAAGVDPAAAIAKIFGSNQIQVMGAQFHLGFSGSKLVMTQVSLSTTIPEPSTYALCGGLGVLGLALWRRRRSRNAAKQRGSEGGSAAEPRV